jgi:hypothetical protein
VGVLNLRFEGGIGPLTRRGPHNSTAAQLQITKHLNLVVLAEEANFFCGCFEFEALKVELAPQYVGDLRIPLRARFQITKHLNLAVLVQGGKLLVDVLNLWLRRWNWTSNT